MIYICRGFTTRMKMWKIMILTLILVGIAILLLSFRILFFKNGKFPSSHVKDNKALSQKGIHCAQAQDKQAQNRIKLGIKN